MPDAFTLATAFACLFFAVLFFQSGLDKVIDWSGNLAWLTGHFEKTPLKGVVPLMLGLVTLVELMAGLASVLGLLYALNPRYGLPPTLGLGLSCLALTMLFFGQRMAKDYAGAAVLAAYFAVGLAGLLAAGLSMRA
ncbi:MAG: DoxX family membrane protein [Fimbriimonadaceae bacterium]|nr:DoxX family membrane protein [Fimbriimonadaceae bacterium]QYK58237.1 MAG: DoxX family membrane protein [Fimbriimonadaceae bacterium]